MAIITVILIAVEMGKTGVVTLTYPKLDTARPELEQSG